MKNILFKTLVLLSLCLTCNVFASSFSIPAGAITDHSNPSIVGSIAWYFSQYGGGTQAAPNTFYLTTDGATVSPYYLNNTLVMPPWARISESGTTNARLYCSSTWASSGAPVVSMDTGCILLHIEVNCQWKSQTGIYGGPHDAMQVIDVIVQNSARMSDSFLIRFHDTTNLLIQNCLLRRAGCDSSESNFNRLGNLIKLYGGNGVTITGNNMATCGHAGIALTSGAGPCLNVTINNNAIFDVGRSIINTADGITCYNSGVTIDRNIWIQSNTIYNSQNHGVHVDGRGWHIENNTIYNCGLSTAASNIYLGSGGCSQYCSIKNNALNNCPIGGGPSIKVRQYKTGTITVSGNTGCNGVEYTLSGCN